MIVVGRSVGVIKGVLVWGVRCLSEGVNVRCACGRGKVVFVGVTEVVLVGVHLG